MQAIHFRFHRAGKQQRNNTFSWPLLLMTLCENAWKMQGSRARENFKKPWGKQGIHKNFRGAEKQSTKTIMAFTIGNFVGISEN